VQRVGNVIEVLLFFCVMNGTFWTPDWQTQKKNTCRPWNCPQQSRSPRQGLVGSICVRAEPACHTRARRLVWWKMLLCTKKRHFSVNEYIFVTPLLLGRD